MENNEVWEEAANCLRILSHPHRLYMIHLLLQKSYSVGELAEACQILPNVASEHLNVMKNKGFITSHKKGKQVFYTIQEPALANILSCVECRFLNEGS